MRFAAIDDDPCILKQISSLLAKLVKETDIETVCFHDPSVFLETYESQKYDAVFLDIDMPGINGFELAQQLHDQKYDVPIVYITGRDDLITHAFRYKALGFVRKQYMETELPYAVSTIISEIQKSNHMITLTEIRSRGSTVHTVSIDHIRYIESFKHNVNIHLVDGKILIIRNTLSYYMSVPGFENFVMINSGTIVNLALITLDEDKVIFDDELKLFVSRRKIQSVRDAYLNFMRRVLI